MFSYIMARSSSFSMKWWWSPLYTRSARLIGFIIVLVHRNNSPRIDISSHSDTLSWFRANQSLLFLFNAACLAEKQQITNFVVFGLTRPGLEPTIYRTRGDHANHYATDAVVYKWIEELQCLFDPIRARTYDLPHSRRAR